jgi:hypothetical protein
MARISIRSGTEGPRHDPYSWSEITFTKTDGTVIQLREGGLGYGQFTINGVQEARVYDDEYIQARFLILTGLTIARANDIYHERFYYADPMGHPSMYI